MSRRNWIKIYPEGFLRRTLYYEIPNPGERWAWIGFLCLAGDNALDGQISVTEGMGYTDEQLAKLLDINIKVLISAKEKMVKYEKISVDKNNVIQILSWKTYQSEYQRQRDYREEYKQKLQRKVTSKNDSVKLPIDRDRDRDKEEEEDKDNIKEDIVEEIIKYLNDKAKKNFKSNSKVTIGKIKARINEGYLFNDFKKVIDIKTNKWKTDPKMCDYLRPETLFGNKFEGYLNEKIIKKQSTGWEVK